MERGECSADKDVWRSILSNKISLKVVLHYLTKTKNLSAKVKKLVSLGGSMLSTILQTESR